MMIGYVGFDSRGADLARRLMRENEVSVLDRSGIGMMNELTTQGARQAVSGTALAAACTSWDEGDPSRAAQIDRTDQPIRQETPGGSA